jgi:cytoplasmic iron level regulating protein YaaA (DUF328/UPF0246 family)
MQRRERQLAAEREKHERELEQCTFQPQLLTQRGKTSKIAAKKEERKFDNVTDISKKELRYLKKRYVTPTKTENSEENCKVIYCLISQVS